MFFWILVGALAVYSVILGVLGVVADRHNRAGWQCYMEELERRHG